MQKLIDTPLYDVHARVIQDLGVTVNRADAAGDTLYLARELEFVSARSYDVLRDPIKGRQFVPFENVPAGADSFSYDMYDRIARAEWITNYASIPGAADAFRKRFTKPLRDFGTHYEYTVQDLQRAAFAGSNGGRAIDTERAKSARLGIEQFLDDVIAVGDVTRDIPGLAACDALFPEVDPVTGEWTADDDGSETVSLAFLADLQILVDSVEQSTAELFQANTLILPLSFKPKMKRRYSAQDARSREAVFLANQDKISKVDYWKRLNTASVLGGPRAIAYVKDPSVIKFLLAYDYQELPPQIHAWSYQVPASARVGGLCVPYPLATGFMDLDKDPTP